MSTFKRSISLLLVMVILAGVFSPAAQATPVEDAATVNTDSVTVEGTNGFGNLLSQEITESQEEAEAADEEYPGGYTVTDLVIEGNTVTVTYDTMEAATLVVALYTEDGMQMLTSTTATVTPDATEAELTFEGNMPEYFLASAYLLDSYDFSPLCAAYDTPMYTREMQELLASTVEDYDPEKVLNLDEDETTNFAVYADSTVIIEPEEGVNTVASIDDENSTYVIKNADETISSLSVGDVFAYPYETDELLLVKIGEITVTGTTVTIVGDELTLDEVFSHVKVENEANTYDVTVTDLDPNDGIDYEGLNEQDVQPDAWEGGAELEGSHYFGVEKTFKDKAENKEITIKGGLEASFDLNVDFYISWTRRFVKVTLDTDVGFFLNVSGSISTNFKNFAEFKIGPIKGVTIIMKPKIDIEFSGELNFEAGIHLPLGFSYETDKGLRNLCSAPRIETELDVEGTFFIGVDMNPSVTVISKYVASAEASVPVGVQIGAELTGTDFDEVLVGSDNVGPSIHTCKKCLDISISIKAELEVKLKFLNSKHLTVEDKFEITPIKFPFYWSFTNADFGSGGCPYEAYRVTVHVVNAEQSAVKNAVVTANGETKLTNLWGNAYLYLPAGTHTVTATGGVLTRDKEVFVQEETKLTINLTEDEKDAANILDFADNSLKSELADSEDGLDTAMAVYNGHTYTLFNGRASSWEAARKYCESLGGHLATIANAEENAFLYDYMRNSGYSNAYWGLTDREKEGVWEWCTGEPVTYTNWAPNEPSNTNMIEHYGMFWSGTEPGYWNDGEFGYDVYNGEDHSCYAFICEWDYVLTKGHNPQNSDSNDVLIPNAVYPGDYSTETTDTYTVKTASFKDLVPNEQYVLLAMASIEVKDPLAPDNLLFIEQETALENGVLSFRYVQRTPHDISYVMVCGASHKNLNDAEITFPEMVADGDLQVVNPVVVYDGVTLTEGRDYVIVGKVDFTEVGEYTCYIRGIRNYTGLVECAYRVKSAQQENPFTDVPPGSYFYEPVLWALEKGITAGVDATHFGPNVACTRAQVVTFLWSAAGKPEPATTVNPFVDVAVSDWYYKAVLWAYENKITSGVDATHFGSAAVCTREQVVTFLWSSKNKPDSSIEVTFADVKPGMYFYDAVAWAVENKVTSGMGDGTFGAGKTCTRAQVVTFLYAVR